MSYRTPAYRTPAHPPPPAKVPRHAYQEQPSALAAWSGILFVLTAASIAASVWFDGWVAAIGVILGVVAICRSSERGP